MVPVTPSRTLAVQAPGHAALHWHWHGLAATSSHVQVMSPRPRRAGAASGPPSHLQPGRAAASLSPRAGVIRFAGCPAHSREGLAASRNLNPQSGRVFMLSDRHQCPGSTWHAGGPGPPRQDGGFRATRVRNLCSAQMSRRGLRDADPRLDMSSCLDVDLGLLICALRKCQEVDLGLLVCALRKCQEVDLGLLICALRKCQDVDLASSFRATDLCSTRRGFRDATDQSPTGRSGCLELDTFSGKGCQRLQTFVLQK